MTVPPVRERASFEVTKRLLCQILNEGLVSGTLETFEPEGPYLCLFSNGCVTEKPGKCIRVRLQPSARAGIFIRSGRIVSLVRPEMLQMPVTLVDGPFEGRELRSGPLFQFASSLFTEHVEATTLEEIASGLENSEANTEKWLELHSSPEPLHLNSPSIMWERALIWGHPTHPFHRLCYAQEGLAPVEPNDLPEFLTPTLAFVSVLRAEISLAGPFEESLQPLLAQLEVPPPESADRVIVPCLRLQLPCVFRHFPSAVVVKTVSGCADTQASMRTLTLRPELNFPYHIKLSIACQITSDVRAIRPCQTLGGQLVRKQLRKFFPPDLWWFKEVASVSGSQTVQGDTQENEDKARHIGCILREDLEARANANNEALIIAGSLAQQPANDSRTHAEIVFGLETVEQKHEWLREYVAGLLRAVLPSLVQYGIGMEAHGQNTLVRVCRQTKKITGFVVRDFEGIKVHVPTLEKLGIKLCMTSPGCTKNLENIWSKIHHAIFQNHLGNLVYALGLDCHDGWTIIRDELTGALKPDMDPRAKELYDFILQDTMPFKCFLRMRMSEHFNDYDGDEQDAPGAKRDERPLPNALLMGSDKWEKILDDHAQRMRWT
ncbi:siderophore [Aspergillus pseudoviridinutans]|uniref:Siderophore n=1 Tax=Aspergillus pseudoviridinutans TaxID=1517512 RepID=A0A9P3BFG8_9EURO|nr:siderophore [Aspergillus pseudoviridinutans]GIJ86766.1 siderophore [Aspergillus pseudoviridinutans]